jgi:hypothetical protein
MTILLAQILILSAIAFIASAYVAAYREVKKMSHRYEKGLNLEDFGWMQDNMLVYGSWRHIESNALLLPSVTRQCFELRTPTIESGDYHYRPVTQVNENGTMEKYTIPFPILKEDIIKLDALVTIQTLKPNQHEIYLQSVVS